MPKGIYIRKAFTEDHKRKLSEALIGNKRSVGRNHSEETKRKIGEALMGDKNHNWKGDSIGYGGLHDWVERHLGKPDTCTHCGISGLSGHSIHWANKSHEYKREKEDWLRLCVPCHKRYDLDKKEAYATMGIKK